MYQATDQKPFPWRDFLGKMKSGELNPFKFKATLYSLISSNLPLPTPAYLKYPDTHLFLEISQIEPLLNTMHELEIHHDASIYTKAIERYCDNGLTVSAYRFLGQMEANSIRRENHIYNALMQCHIKMKDPTSTAAIQSLLERMKSENLIPNRNSYKSLIKSFAFLKTHQAGDQLMDLMMHLKNIDNKHFGIKTYNSALSVLMKISKHKHREVATRLKDHAMKILNEILGDPKTASPDEMTYAYLMAIHNNIHTEESAKFINEDLIGYMRRDGVRETALTTSERIRAYAKLGTPEAARAAEYVFYNNRQAMGIKYDANVYRQLFYAFSNVGTREFVQKMTCLTRDMERNSIAVSHEIATLIHSTQEKSKTTPDDTDYWDLDHDTPGWW